ncbi:MAG: hypothetical protein CM15mP130_2990 [Verrucomicrobiota bacterium]|nr:MAG: hypothetical protein CM15mP130_2990 [Verrucomicrobiota bacterium]
MGKIRSYKPNGKEFPRIVLFSPIAFEDLKIVIFLVVVPHNRNLAAFAKGNSDAAKEAEVATWTLFGPSTNISGKQRPLTLNGVHLNEVGKRKVGEVIAKALLGMSRFFREIGGLKTISP